MKQWLLLIAWVIALQGRPLPAAHEAAPSRGGETDPAACRVSLCWNEREKHMVAFICYEEMRGLLQVGMASCAASIATRQSQPEIWGESLDDLLRFDQYTVGAAKTRPWEQGELPSPAALQAVEYFLRGERGNGGCWGYDSFQGSTPEAARDWLAAAPERRCVIVHPLQAALFFNWRDG